MGVNLLVFVRFVHELLFEALYGDVLATGMDGVGAFADVGAFAAAIEAAEKRKNSSLMRDVQVALPSELTVEQGTALTKEFALMLATRYHTHSAWAVHRPDRRGDARNRHSHIVLPTRALDEQGQLGPKLRILDEHKTGRVEVTKIRQQWELMANTHLERAGSTARVDVSRRQDGDAMPTLGQACTAIEREEAQARSEAVEGKSVATLVTSGEPVTWRGRALQRHQQHLMRKHRAEQRAPADEHLADIVCSEVQAEDAAVPVRIGLHARLRAQNNSVVALPVAVATPSRVELRRGKLRPQGIEVAEAHVEPAASPAPMEPRRVASPPRAVAVRVARPSPPSRPSPIVARRPQAPWPQAVDVGRAQPAAVATPSRVELRRGELRPQGIAVAEVAEAHVEPAATPVPIARRRVGPAPRPVVVHAARPVPPSRPSPIVARRQSPPLPRPVMVRQAHLEPAGPRPAPVRLRRETPRPHRAVAVHDVRVQAAARPVRVSLDRAVQAPAPAAADVRALPAPAATRRRPASRSRPVVGHPVEVRPVQAAAEIAPRQLDLAALATPRSLQEIGDRLNEEVYSREDAGAARSPAGVGQSVAIGYANWSAVWKVMQHEDELCSTVAARAVDRASADGQRNESAVHDSWAERIAAWIREHVAAAVDLLELRLRHEAAVAKAARQRAALATAEPGVGVTVTNEDRVRLAVHDIAAKLPRTQPYPGNRSHCPFAVSDERFRRVAAATNIESVRTAIGRLEGRYSANERTESEAEHLQPIISRQHEENLKAAAQRRLSPAPTWAEAQLAVIKEFEAELLDVMETTWREVEKRPPAAVRHALQVIDPVQVTTHPIRPAIHTNQQDRRGESGPSR